MANQSIILAAAAAAAAAAKQVPDKFPEIKRKKKN